MNGRRSALALALLLALATGSRAQEAQEPKTFLGIRMSVEHSALAGKGVLVVEVVPGFAAERAGVAIGDVVRSFDGKEVRVVEDLYNAIQARAPGDEVEVLVLRDGREEKIGAALGPWPAEMPEQDGRHFPDPMTLAAIEERTRLAVAECASGLGEGVVHETATIRGFVSFLRSTSPEAARPDRIDPVLETIAWCEDVARAGIQPPVNPIDAEGNAIYRVRDLVGRLGSPEFQERDRATRALRAIGEPARVALEEAARSEDLEVGHRAAALLDELDEGLRGEDYRPIDLEVLAGRGVRPRCGERPGHVPLLLAVLRDGGPGGTVWLSADGAIEGEVREGDRLLGFLLDLE